MGKCFGLVRVLATVLLLWSPTTVFAAPTPGEATSAAPAKAKKTVAKTATKKAPAKAKKKVAAKQRAPKVRYNAPITSTIIVDAGTGRVLSEDNADVRGYPASLTKMMTLFMLFEALEHRSSSLCGCHYRLSGD